MTKKDLVTQKIPDIIKWSSSRVKLEEAIESGSENERTSSDHKILSRDILRALYRQGVISAPILYSNITMDGIVNLTGALSRILSLGEQTYD
jgi:GPN-loop GTPase